MIGQIDQGMYRYITEIELTMLMRYKIQMIEVENKMSMPDLQILLHMLQKRHEEDMKEQQGGNKLMKSLVAIRDILNYMTLNDNAIR